MTLAVKLAKAAQTAGSLSALAAISASQLPTRGILARTATPGNDQMEDPVTEGHAQRRPVISAEHRSPGSQWLRRENGGTVFALSASSSIVDSPIPALPIFSATRAPGSAIVSALPVRKAHSCSSEP